MRNDRDHENIVEGDDFDDDERRTLQLASGACPPFIIYLFMHFGYDDAAGGGMWVCNYNRDRMHLLVIMGIVTQRRLVENARSTDHSLRGYFIVPTNPLVLLIINIIIMIVANYIGIRFARAPTCHYIKYSLR